MESSGQHIIYTIGHSTYSLDTFIQMLVSFDIQIVADIRSLPDSHKFPQFNKENLAISLERHSIQYIHMEALGGRRKVLRNSKNTRWHHPSFRGYADYMETEAFKDGIIELEKFALKASTAYMCAEAVWWRCHRSMISDYLKARGWKVMHIMSASKAEEHSYTSPARIVDNHVFYSDEDIKG